MAKTVYILVHRVHTKALSAATERALRQASAGTPSALQKASSTVRAFWDDAVNKNTTAGALWREVFELAEKSVNYDHRGYAGTMKLLRNKLARLLSGHA